MEDKFTEYRKNLTEIYEKAGWVVQGVGGTDKEPGFIYTAGLSDRFDHPEIFTVAITEFDILREILNVIAEKVKNGTAYTEACYVDEVIKHHPVALVPMTDESANEHGGSAVFINGGKPVKGIQVFFPDAKGLFPWESGCDQSFKNFQEKIFKTTGTFPEREIPKNKMH